VAIITYYARRGGDARSGAVRAGDPILELARARSS